MADEVAVSFPMRGAMQKYYPWANHRLPVALLWREVFTRTLCWPVSQQYHTVHLPDEPAVFNNRISGFGFVRRHSV